MGNFYSFQNFWKKLIYSLQTLFHGHKKIQISPFVCQSYILVCYTHVIGMSHVCACIYLYVLVCYSYVIRIYSMSSVCHSYVLVCHPYVTRMYSYVIRMLLVCTRMPSVSHSYVLECHPYVTDMWFYHDTNFAKCCHPLKTLICNTESWK